MEADGLQSQPDQYRPGLYLPADLAYQCPDLCTKNNELSFPSDPTDMRSPKRKIKVPRLAFEILTNSGMVNRRLSIAELEGKAILSMRNTGLDLEQISLLFKIYPGQGYFKSLFNQDEQQALDWLQKTYQSADQKSSVANYARRLAFCQFHWGIITSVEEFGSKAAKITYLGLCTIAHACGKKSFHASTRELSQVTGCSLGIISSSLRCLKERCLIKLVKSGNGMHANEFILVAKTHLTDASKTGKIVNLYGHDAYHRSGLKRVGADISYFLQIKPGSTAKEIADQTENSLPQVRKLLNQMHSLGMVEKREACKWYPLEHDLIGIAERLGTTGTGEKLKQKHAYHRFDRETVLYPAGWKRRQVRSSYRVEKWYSELGDQAKMQQWINHARDCGITLSTTS